MNVAVTGTMLLRILITRSIYAGLFVFYYRSFIYCISGLSLITIIQTILSISTEDSHAHINKAMKDGSAKNVSESSVEPAEYEVPHEL